MMFFCSSSRDDARNSYDNREEKKEEEKIHKKSERPSYHDGYLRYTRKPTHRFEGNNAAKME